MNHPLHFGHTLIIGGYTKSDAPIFVYGIPAHSDMLRHIARVSEIAFIVNRASTRSRAISSQCFRHVLPPPESDYRSSLQAAQSFSWIP